MTRILSGGMSSTRRVAAARTRTRTPTTTAVVFTAIAWFPITADEVSADGVVVVVDVTPAARIQRGTTSSPTEMNTQVSTAVAVEMISSLTDPWASVNPSFSIFPVHYPNTSAVSFL
jgi:hypothetical protein